MGLSPGVGAPAHTRSGCGPQATRQRTELSPSPPARRQTSWGNPQLKPWTPALKRMGLPSVRPNSTRLSTYFNYSVETRMLLKRKANRHMTSCFDLTHVEMSLEDRGRCWMVLCFLYKAPFDCRTLVSTAGTRF